MKTIIALGFISMLVGCESRNADSFNVGISPEFSSFQQNLIHQSLIEWETATNGRVSFSTEIEDCSRNDSANLICFHLATRAYIESLDPETGLIALTKRNEIYADLPGSVDKHSDSSDIYLPSDDEVEPSQANSWKQSATHEIGHALSLKHDPNANGVAIMYYSQSGAAKAIMCNDVLAYERLRNMFESDCTPNGPL